MKEQWIQQMQQKLAGYRIAAAVVVLVAVTTGYLALNQQEETITANNVETEVRHEKENPQPKEEKIVAKESVSHKSKMLSVSHKPQVLPTDTLPSEPLPEPEVLQQEEAVPVQLAEDSSASHDEDSRTQIANTSPMPLPLDYPTDVRKPAVSGNRLMAKVYLTNGAMRETEHNIPTEIIYRYNYSYIGPDGKPIPDTPTKRLSDYASGAAKSDVYHNLPIRYGLSLRYRFNNRWSIESGLVYSHHRSDIHTSLPTDLKPELHVTANIEQTLSYIGIPVNVSYQLWGNRYGNLYVTAGGMAEKMVKGRLHVEKSEEWEEKTESVSIRPLQFSVNGAIGAEFNLSRWFSIYAEPGVGYYFDNGSSLPTYYRDKPFGFNLNVGLKINIK